MRFRWRVFTTRIETTLLALIRSLAKIGQRNQTGRLARRMLIDPLRAIDLAVALQVRSLFGSELLKAARCRNSSLGCAMERVGTTSAMDKRIASIFIVTLISDLIGWKRTRPLLLQASAVSKSYAGIRAL